MSRSRGEAWGLGNGGPQAPGLLDTAHARSAPPLPQARPGPAGTRLQGPEPAPTGMWTRAISSSAGTASGEGTPTSKTQRCRKSQSPASGRGTHLQEL